MVSSRYSDGAAADLHLLLVNPPPGSPARQPLTRTEHLDETAPAFSPDGEHVAFIRSDNVFRLDVRSGRTQRLTGGFRIMRYPRFLPSGRLLCLWTHGKQFGLDVMDGDGENRQTLGQGTNFYRTLAPSPDGKYLAVTLGFQADALKFRQSEEVRLLDLQGRAWAFWRSPSAAGPTRRAGGVEDNRRGPLPLLGRDGWGSMTKGDNMRRAQLAAALLAAGTASAADRPADLVLTNASVITLDDGAPPRLRGGRARRAHRGRGRRGGREAARRAGHAHARPRRPRGRARPHRRPRARGGPRRRARDARPGGRRRAWRRR